MHDREGFCTFKVHLAAVVEVAIIDAGGMFTTNSSVAQMFARVSRLIHDARAISSRGQWIGVMFDQGATFYGIILRYGSYECNRQREDLPALIGPEEHALPSRIEPGRSASAANAG